MFLLYFLLPVAAIILFEIPDILKEGAAYRLSRAIFWIRLCLCEIFTVAMLDLLFMSFTAFLSFSLLGLLVSALASFGFVVIWWGIENVRMTRSALSMLILSLTVALFLEATVFNFRFYQSYYYESVDLSDDMILSAKFVETENENEYAVNGPSPYILLQNVDTEIENIYVDITARNSSGSVVNAYVDIYMTDESNENYLRLPAQTVMSEVESTKFLYLVTNGVSDNIRLVISSNYAKTYEINGIHLNVSQDFHFSILRLIALALLIWIFWLLRPSSPLWRHRFNDSLKQRITTGIVVGLEIVLLLIVSVLNPAFATNPSSHTAQYQQLAESFLDGQLYLQKEPPEFLAQMENPYDTVERSQMAAENKTTYYWDAAYYNGHYYVYFGVLPVLLFYLPFRLITGYPLTNLSVIQICLCVFAIGSFMLIAKLLKKYFRHTCVPYLSYLLLSLIFVNAAGGIFIAKRPDFYSIPILLAMGLTVWGLYFWLRSTDKEGRISPMWAGLGSLFMALVAACRPQLLVGSAIALIIFWGAVFRERSLFSKKSIWSTVAICLPYVLVAAGVMWYNFARFGSPFDFGANYNLTTNDMTGRGFNVERVGLSLFTYFFQLPNITAAFPFLQGCEIDTNYLGTTITEPMFGGIFIVIPILWVLVLLPRYGKELGRRGLLAFCTVPVMLALFLGVFDAQGAGLLARYVSDFAFLACLSAVMMFFFLYERSLGENRMRIHSFMRFALFASGAYCFMCIFAKYSVEIFYKNPYLFNWVSELVQFW